MVGCPGRTRLRSGGAFCSPSARSTSPFCWVCTRSYRSDLFGSRESRLCHRAARAAQRRLCVRLRLPLDLAARRRAENLSVRHLAFEHLDRALGRHRRRALLRHSVGHRFARAREDRAFRYRKKYFQNDRAADRARGVLLLVRGDLDEFLGQRFGKFVVDRHLRADRNRARAARLQLSRPCSIRHRRDGRRHCRLCRVHVQRRRADVFRALAGASRRRHAIFSDYLSGLHDVATRWIVTHNIAQWHNEIPWMSLYFSVAVWTSLLLGGFGLVRHLLPRYRVRRPLVKATRRPGAIPVRSS